jgi:hypothetical protein
MSGCKGTDGCRVEVLLSEWMVLVLEQSDMNTSNCLLVQLKKILLMAIYKYRAIGVIINALYAATC